MATTAACKDLPPREDLRLSRAGWAVLGLSLAAGATLNLWAPPVFAFCYLAVVLLGFVLGLPGWLAYQCDIEQSLAEVPGAESDKLPCPRDYSDLTRAQRLRYAARGIGRAAFVGISFPVLTVLALLAELRLVPERIFAGLIEQLFSGPRQSRRAG